MDNDYQLSTKDNLKIHSRAFAEVAISLALTESLLYFAGNLGVFDGPLYPLTRILYPIMIPSVYVINLNSAKKSILKARKREISDLEKAFE